MFDRKIEACKLQTRKTRTCFRPERGYINQIFSIHHAQNIDAQILAYDFVADSVRDNSLGFGYQ